MSTAKIILIADDDAFNRDGLRLYLSGEGLDVLEAGDEETGQKVAAENALDAAVIDIAMPSRPGVRVRPNDSGGIRLARRIKETSPAVGVVIFSAYEDRGSDVLEMLRTGTRGLAYKLKGCAPAVLLRTIEDVMAGRVIIDPEVHANRRGLAEELRKRLTPEERHWVDAAASCLSTLTAREKEIARRLAACHNTEGIARAVNVTAKTAENYIGHVYDKLGLSDMGRETPHLRKVLILAKVCMIDDLQTEH